MAKKKKEDVEEEEKVEAKKTDEDIEEPAAAPQPATADAAEEEFSPEDEARFVFPMAPIVRLMKQEMDEDKMIRRRVKESMNQWLESLCRKVAKKMNQSEYTMVEVDDFKTAIEPYDMIDATEQERLRIVATLEKIKQDCDSLIMDVNRKFITP
jgi:histone H3/H4